MRMILRRKIFLSFLFLCFSFETFPALSSSDDLRSLRPPSSKSVFQDVIDALPSLGMIVGADYDQTENRLVLVGDGRHLDCSPTLPQIAVAFRYAFGEDQQYPYASIDPFPENPKGPYMKVVTNDDAWDTEFGWIMYEADRMVKCYSLGEDNITHDRVESQVSGYENEVDMNLAKKADANKDAIWSRYWLYPRSNAVQASDVAIRIEDAVVGVQTETMRWEGSKLVSAPDSRDECAERFAEMFTRNYRAFADERKPIRQVEQLMRLLLIAEWIRKENIPVDLDWIDQFRAPRFWMPRVTPSLTVTGEKELPTSIRSVWLFGGTKLDVVPRYRQPDKTFSDFVGTVASSSAEKRTGGFAFRESGKQYRGAIFPSKSEMQTAREVVTDLKVDLPSGQSVELQRRPSLVPEVPGKGSTGRNTLGDGWELALPSLRSYNPTGRDGSIQSYGIEGMPDQNVEVRTFELYDVTGEKLGRFEEYGIDQELTKVVVHPTEQNNPWRLYPEGDGVVWAVGPRNRRWAFGQESGRFIGEQIDNEIIRYNYEDGVLTEITADESGRGISLSHDPSGKQITGGETSDGKNIRYQEKLGIDRPVKAVLYDAIGQEHRLTIGSSSGKWTSKGEGVPIDYIDPHALEVAEIAGRSSPKCTFVNVMEEGGITLLQVGNVLKQINTTRDQVDRHLESCHSARRKSEIVEETIEISELEGLENFAVISNSRPERRTLSTNITEIKSDATVFRSTDLSRAETNIEEYNKPRRGKVDILTFEETFDAQHKKILGDLAGDTPTGRKESSDVLIIVAHRTKKSGELLQKVGPRLNGKIVIYVSCGDVDNPDKLSVDGEKMVEEYGATAFVEFWHKIPAEAARRFSEEMRALSQDRNHWTVEQLIKDAIERCKEEHPEDKGDSERLKYRSPFVFRQPIGGEMLLTLIPEEAPWIIS